MAGELVWRSLANGAVVVAIMWVMRRRGQRAAGLLAGLPVLSAPALFTLSLHPDPAVATAAAVAGLHTTGLTASLVLCYGVARRPLGAPLALLFAALCTLAVARLSAPVSVAFGPALALTLLLVGMARRYLPHLSPHGSMCRFLRGYLDGLLVRSCFLAVLAFGLAPFGGWLAFPLAMLAAVAALLGVTALRQRGDDAGGCATDGGSATTLAERS